MTNMNITQTGVANPSVTNDTLFGIIVNVNNINTTLNGGTISLPNYTAPSTSDHGAVGYVSDAANSTVKNVTIHGTVDNPASWSQASCSGRVHQLLLPERNCRQHHRRRTMLKRAGMKFSPIPLCLCRVGTPCRCDGRRSRSISIRTQQQTPPSTAPGRSCWTDRCGWFGWTVICDTAITTGTCSAGTADGTCKFYVSTSGSDSGNDCPDPCHSVSDPRLHRRQASQRQA